MTSPTPRENPCGVVAVAQHLPDALSGAVFDDRVEHHPGGPDRTLETYDFFLETPEPDEAELDAIRYLDEVLQVEDIDMVESVQRGMNTPAFTQGGS